LFDEERLLELQHFSQSNLIQTLNGEGYSNGSKDKRRGTMIPFIFDVSNKNLFQERFDEHFDYIYTKERMEMIQKLDYHTMSNASETFVLVGPQGM